MYRQTNRQIDRHIVRETNIYTVKWTNRQIDKQIEIKAEKVMGNMPGNIGINLSSKVEKAR